MNQGWVLSHDDGSCWEPSRFSTLFREFHHQTGLPHSRFRDLRHRHCSYLLAHGVPLKLASERMGHSTIAVPADLHGHILKGQDRAAADLFTDALSQAMQRVAEVGWERARLPVVTPGRLPRAPHTKEKSIARAETQHKQDSPGEHFDDR
jgi:hypothetical protein